MATVVQNLIGHPRLRLINYLQEMPRLAYFRVLASVAPGLLMMDFEVGRSAAHLAEAAVAAKYLLPEFLVFRSGQPQRCFHGNPSCTPSDRNHFLAGHTPNPG